MGRVRADFPALVGDSGRERVAHFDGPAGALVPARVITSMRRQASRDAGLRAQAAFADWLGGSAAEIVLGPSMTSLATRASQALAPAWNPGDNIVLTRQDHCANTDPWRRAAAGRGVDVRWVQVDGNGSLDLADLARVVTDRTRLLAFSAASNVTGTINEVPSITALARRYGALVFVDAVHFAAHRLGNAARWDCDFVACSAYKFYGPRVAGLWVRSGACATIDPRWGAGSIAPALLAGVDAAVDYVAGNGDGATRRTRLEHAIAAIAAHERHMAARLRDGLLAIPGVRVFGLPADGARTATVAFAMEGRDAPGVGARLARLGFRVGHGHFNARPLVRALGAGDEGILRAGCMMYTNANEVDSLLDAIDASRLARGLKRSVRSTSAGH